MNQNQLGANYYQLHASKKNDVDRIKLAGIIRQKACAAGFTTEECNLASTKMGKVYRERDKNTEVKQPPAKEATPTPETIIPDKRTEERLSKRVTTRLESVPGLSPSGVRKTGASGGKSIVDNIL